MCLDRMGMSTCWSVKYVVMVSGFPLNSLPVCLRVACWWWLLVLLMVMWYLWNPMHRVWLSRKAIILGFWGVLRVSLYGLEAIRLCLLTKKMHSLYADVFVVMIVLMRMVPLGLMAVC